MVEQDAHGSPRRGLADLLRERTGELHRRVERSGVIADLLHGRARRSAYLTLLRNLLPVYEQLERGLESRRGEPGVAGIAERAVYRSAALAADLEALGGASWAEQLPLSSAGARYAQRVEAAARTSSALLIGHAYTRYLGDLSGGRLLRDLLARALALGPDELHFYAYPAIPDLSAFRARYRNAFDEAGRHVDADAVASEASAAFQLNLELSQEIGAASCALPRTDDMRCWYVGSP